MHVETLWSHVFNINTNFIYLKKTWIKVFDINCKQKSIFRCICTYIQNNDHTVEKCEMHNDESSALMSLS